MRLIYEIDRQLKTTDFIRESDGLKTLRWALEEKIISHLEFGKENISVKEISDLEEVSSPTAKTPCYLLSVVDYLPFETRVFLQAATEPNLKKNCFTQSQVVEYIIKHKKKLLEAYQQTFLIFKNNKEKLLVLCIERNSTWCSVDEVDNHAVWTNKTLRSIVIKTIR
jgi:hypothetical protein